MWDFDGVIVNSIDECLITSYNAYYFMKDKNHDLVRNIKEIPKTNKDVFYKLRKYVRPAGEYFIIYFCIDNNIIISDYQQFETLIKSHFEVCKQYQYFFFRSREKLMKDNLENWLQFSNPYKEVAAVWNKLSKHFVFYIVSNKNKKAISRLLQYYYLAINEANIYGADFSSRKTDIIKHILVKTDIASHLVHFIDDNYHHLSDMVEQQINCYFAAWGYGEQPDETNYNITHVNLNNFDKILMEKIS